MAFRELTEPPLSADDRAALARYGDVLSTEDPLRQESFRRLTDVEGILDVRISSCEPGLTRVHEETFWRLGFQAQRGGHPIPDAGALPRVGRRNLSAWQKGWCLAEREGADVL